MMKFSLRIARYCIPLLFVFSAFESVAADDSDKLAEVVTGWQQNRQLIGGAFVCEFKINVYSYSNGDTPVLLYTQFAVWARLGEFERYSIEGTAAPKKSEDESLPKKSGGAASNRTHGMGGGSLSGWKRHCLQSSNAQLSYSPVMSVANIHEGVQYSRGITMTPLSYGVMGANEHRSLPKIIDDLADVDGSQTQVDLIRDVGIGGAITLKTTRREVSPSGVEWDNIMEWRVDPNSGFLPLDVTAFDAPDVWASKTKVNEVRQLESGAYWPFSIQTVSNPDSAFPRIFELKTTRLIFDPAKVKDALSLPVPVGTMILSPESMRPSFKHLAPEIRPEDLARMLIQAGPIVERRNLDGM